MENNTPKTCEELVVAKLLKAEGDNFDLAMQISELEDENLKLKDELETERDLLKEFVKALDLYMRVDIIGGWIGVSTSVISDKCLVAALVKRFPEITKKEDN